MKTLKLFTLILTIIILFEFIPIYAIFDESGGLTESGTVFDDVLENEQEIEAYSTAASIDYGDYTYTVNNDGTTATITGYTGSEEIIIIPGDVNEYNVSVIGDDAFSNCTTLTAVTIPDSVTNIGERAFLNCGSLTSVEIPDSVTNISDGAFDACVSLTNVMISKNVINIGEGVYNNCIGLISFNVSDLNQFYSSDEFGVLFNTDKSRLLAYPSGNIRTSYTIPDSVTSIRNYAFNNSKNLKNITIPNSVTMIGDITFIYCSSLINISIPENVTNISDSAFNECRNLSVIYGTPGSYAEQYAAENRYFFFSDAASPEIDFDFNSKTGTITGYTGSGGDVVIPAKIGGVSVASIGVSAFLDCVSVTSVVILEGISEIGDSAFGGCSNMVKIHIPVSATNISVTAFSECAGLTIYGYTGSEAERYAAERNKTFRILDVSADTSGIQEEDFQNVKFEVKKANTAWNGDGVISDGEYYRIESKNTWFSCFSYDGRNNNYAKNLMPEIYMSWDEDYIYWASVVTVKNHDCAWDADPASMWNSGCVQMNYSEPNQTEPLSRLEYGVALSSVTGNHLTNNWADAIGSGYDASENNDFFIVNDSNTLTYEVRTPWSAFLADPSVAAGDGLGACFVWSVGEGQDFIHTQLASGCTGFGKNAENFAQLTLVEPVEIQVKQFVPALDGVISADEYPEDSWFVLDKAAATACNGIWIGEMTDDLMAKYNFAWADDGLYAAFVAVDNTPDPATSWDVHGQDGGPSADGFQFNTGSFNWTTIGAYADGTLAPRNHIGGGEEVDSLADIVTGRATREGNIFTVEAFIPWTKLLNYQVAQDSVIPMLIAYIDRADGAENVSYKSMDINLWDAADSNISLKLTAETYTPPENNFTFDSTTGTITEYTGSGGDVIIPATIDGRTVVAVGDSAFYECLSITSITIPDSVTTIGNVAFWGCSGLTSINIPDSVAVIGHYAFTYCTGLTSINIPDSVTTIAYGVFYGCSGLTSIKIPESVTTIAYSAFRDCSGLTSINIPASVTTIGMDAFAGCSNLASITFNSPTTSFYDGEGTFFGTFPGATKIIGHDPSTAKNYAVKYNRTFEVIATSPESDFYFNSTTGTITGYTGLGGDVRIPATIGGIAVTFIGDNAFNGCTDITSINIPASVTTIGDGTFKGCTGLIRINIPATVITIGDTAFYECSGLISITFNSPATAIYDGENTIPAATKIIGYDLSVAKDYAVKYNRIFEDITISPEIDFIIDSATGTITYYLGPGGDVGIPATIGGTTVTNIGDSAFSGYPGLTSVNIPASVIAIGERAFNGCTGLTSINIPASVTTIGEWAFGGCSGLTSINIPVNVTTIGVNAFASCPGLININVQPGNTVYMSEDNCLIETATNKLILGCKTSVIPNYITYIGDYVFAWCSGLTSINIPASVTTIGKSAFYACHGLTSITIPAGVITIGVSAFAWCSGLTSINIPSSVTTIEFGAFDKCSGLTSITFNSPTTIIRDREETIPPSAKIIGYNPSTAKNYAVKYSRTFEVNTVSPESDFTFDSVTGTITGYTGPGGDVEIPTTISGIVVTSIGEQAFYSCSEVTSLILPDSVITIGNGAFAICSSLTSINIPDSVTTIGEGAFQGCSGLTSITVQPGNTIYKSEGNCLIETVAKKLITGCKTSVIPNYITDIGDVAFYGCIGLTSIVIPNSVINIGTGAFGSCSSLISITIPKSVIRIGNNAFNGCTNLIISGYYGSEAERYAAEANIEFMTILEGSVKIIGEVIEDNTLTLDLSKFIPSVATYTVQWKSGGNAAGTGNTYVINAGDVGKRISVVITGTGNYKGTFSDGTSSVIINGSEPGSKPAVVIYPEEVLPDDTVLTVTIIPEIELAEVTTQLISEQIVAGTETLIYTIEAISDNVNVQPKGSVEITLPLGNTAVENLVIIHISREGVIEYIYDHTENITDNTITFKINHFSTFILGESTFKPVSNIENVTTETTAGLPLALTGTITPSDATNQTIVWSVANAGTTGSSITGSTLNTTASGTVTVKATIVNGATANSDYIQQFIINVNEDTVKDIAFNFQGVAIKLIEPWGLRFYTPVSGSDFNTGLPFGTIVLHQDYYTSGMTAEEMMANPNAIILTSESGDSILDSSSRIIGTMVSGIYTYSMNTSYYTAAYVVINGEYIFSPVNSRNIYDRVAYLKDNSTDIYVKPIYQGMYDLYTDVKAYHDSLGTVTIPEPEIIKRGSECSPGTVAVNSGLVSYSFKGVAIRLIEPWGLCFYTEMTTADMNSVTEFGTVVLSEDDYIIGMTGEQIRLSDNSYVFNSTDGTAVYDSSKRIVAKLIDSIYTYNMDKKFYTVSYDVIGGEYYYSDVNCRNMYDRVTLLKDTSSNVYVKEIYASMFSLYGAVDTYHRSLGLK